MTRRERANLRNGLLFAAPFIVGFLAVYLYPLVMTMVYSLQRYNVIKPPVWVGLANYRELLVEDPRFWTALYNTVYFTVLSVPLGLALALGLAMLLSLKVRGQAVYRTIFFLPTIVPVVASAVLWMWVFNPQSGLLNGTLQEFFGIEGPGWMADEHWSKPALILMSFWTVGGAMVIFLAGLADVPQSLYEVADIDGAGPFRRFWNVTLPMVTPVILFNLVIGLINGFQYFTQVYVMTNGRGEPVGSTMFYALYLYRNSFYYLNMGYGSAMAWIMFLIILSATLAVMLSSKRWVHYHGE
ncbi:MAG: sugar ABC transporter permease [Candidatus Hydrogenedentes bacterium]|nr:sugar ABC transporter permease [Candidatus Hydrogenedentota bacterium]